MGLLWSAAKLAKSAYDNRADNAEVEAVAAPSAPLDICRGDAELRAAYDAAVAGQWEHLDSFIKNRPDDWLVTSVLTAEDTAVTTETIRQWASGSPSGVSMSALGWMYLREAWIIRGNGLADTVDKSAWGGFKEALQGAESTLQKAAEIDPGLADPWAGLMVTSRGLSKGQKELRCRFDEAHARQPFRPDACAQMIQGLCAKVGWVEREDIRVRSLDRSISRPSVTRSGRTGAFSPRVGVIRRRCSVGRSLQNRGGAVRGRGIGRAVLGRHASNYPRHASGSVELFRVGHPPARRAIGGPGVRVRPPH
jgi:hypothetical protein